jgi:thioredoxin-like negative regulator of GroEL
MIFKLALLFASAAGSLSWVEDDYAKALAEARSRHVPVFVEVWAPW